MNQARELRALRAVEENAPPGICLTNRELQILLWNRGAEGITGYLRQKPSAAPAPGTGIRRPESTQAGSA